MVFFRNWGTGKCPIFTLADIKFTGADLGGVGVKGAVKKGKPGVLTNLDLKSFERTIKKVSDWRAR